MVILVSITTHFLKGDEMPMVRSFWLLAKCFKLQSTLLAPSFRTIAQLTERLFTMSQSETGGLRWLLFVTTLNPLRNQAMNGHYLNPFIEATISINVYSYFEREPGGQDSVGGS